MAEKNQKGNEEKGKEVYVSADGRVHSTPQAAVDASLAFEQAANTGAGCNQASENIPTPPPAPTGKK